MHLKARTSAGWQWLDERLGLEPVRALLAHKSVPKHSSTIWYYFGGITLFLFGIQVATGILLGWLIRSIHSWAANLMVLAAFVHMFSVVFLHAHRRPREVT